MAQPTFRRFWVRILPDGRAIPQFDPHTGQYCGFEVYPGPVAQIIFMAVTPRLAELIRSQGDIAEPSDLPQLVFDVPPGSSAELHRVGSLRLDHLRVCGFCRAVFDPDLDACPRCLARDQWYCGTCDMLVEPLVDRKTDQVRCPVCEMTDPRGVELIRCIGDFMDERLFTYYVLKIDGRKHLILDYRLRR